MENYCIIKMKKKIQLFNGEIIYFHPSSILYLLKKPNFL